MNVQIGELASRIFTKINYNKFGNTLDMDQEVYT